MSNTKCPSSVVQPQAKILYNGIDHAATVVHVCKLEIGHEDPANADGTVFCVCACGHMFPRFGNVPTGTKK